MGVAPRRRDGTAPLVGLVRVMKLDKFRVKYISFAAVTIVAERQRGRFIMFIRSLVQFVLIWLATSSWAFSADLKEDGENLFLKNCAICHQPAGIGQTGLAPPLIASRGSALARRVPLKDGRAYLLKVLSFGLVGPIEVGTERYSGLMPAFGQLTDTELATIARYITEDLNKGLLPLDFVPFRANEFAAMRAENLRPVDVYKSRRALEGIADQSSTNLGNKK